MTFFSFDAIIIIAVLGLIGFVTLLILYIAKSLSISKLLALEGKTISIGAFIPILNTYLLGKIGDKSNSNISIFGIIISVYLAIVLISLKNILDALGNFVKFGENTWYLFPLIILCVIFRCAAYSRIFLKYNKNGLLFSIINFLFGFGIFSPIFLFFIKIDKIED